MGFPIPYATVKEIIKDSNTVLNITVTNEDGFFELKTTSNKPLIIVEFQDMKKSVQKIYPFQIQLELRNDLTKRSCPEFR